MKHYLKILIFILTLTAVTGCFRDELSFPRPVFLEMNIDWKRSAVDANSATAVIYKDGKYYSTEIFSQYPPVRKLVVLPVGHYDIIVHNDLAYDFRTTLEFKELDKFNSMYATPLDDFKNGNPAKIYKLSPDTLAADRHIGLDITQAMISEALQKPITENGEAGKGTIMKSIDFTPRRSFTNVTVVVNAKFGNGYYFTKNTPPVLHGMAGSYSLGTDLYSTGSVSHRLNLSPLYRYGTSKDLTFTTEFLSVGLAGRKDLTATEILGDYSLTLPFAYMGGVDVREINLKRDATVFRFTPEDPNDPNNNCDLLEIVIDVELDELVLIGDQDVVVDEWDDVDIPLDGPQRLHFASNNGSKESFSRNNLPGVIINLPDASLFTPIAGVEFVAWNTKADGTGVSYNKGDPYEMKRGGAIFYGIWKQNK